MSAAAHSPWQHDFALKSLLFEPLREAANPFSTLDHWPELDDFNSAFQSHGQAIKAVPQGNKPNCFDAYYEPRIFLRGELQTRLGNWHDFMNALVWLRFPATKAALNAQHYKTARLRKLKSNRSPLENKLARFDECGAVVIARHAETLQQIREHQWGQLFCHQRERFEDDIRCLVFGHATYEKALKPYLGMTTNTLLIHAPEMVNADYSAIDAMLAAYWQRVDSVDAIELLPFPILGVPGWHVDNSKSAFYENRAYFRPL